MTARRRGVDQREDVVARVATCTQPAAKPASPTRSRPAHGTSSTPVAIAQVRGSRRPSGGCHSMRPSPSSEQPHFASPAVLEGEDGRCVGPTLRSVACRSGVIARGFRSASPGSSAANRWQAAGGTVDRNRVAGADGRLAIDVRRDARAVGTDDGAVQETVAAEMLDLFHAHRHGARVLAVSDSQVLRTNAEGQRATGRHRGTGPRHHGRSAARQAQRKCQPHSTERHGHRHEIHLRRADEAGDELVGRLVVEIERRAHLLDPARAQHDDLVGHRHRLDLVVRDVHHGRLRAARAVR